MGWLAALAFVGGSALLGYVRAERAAVLSLQAEGSHRLELFSSAVEGMVQRLEHVPATVQLSEEIQRLFHGARTPALRDQADHYLQRLNAFTATPTTFAPSRIGCETKYAGRLPIRLIAKCRPTRPDSASRKYGRNEKSVSGMASMR